MLRYPQPSVKKFAVSKREWTPQIPLYFIPMQQDENDRCQSMEQELEQLNELLFHFETIDSFCIAHEVFDIHRHKTLYKRDTMQKIIREKELKPFVFICNKN